MVNSATKGSMRERIAANSESDQAHMQKLVQTNTLIVDDRRRRPLYFDGRFLDAAALTREQDYFLTRQSDLGRAGGSGVVFGLQISSTTGGRTLQIEAGHGVTPSGESVVLPAPLTLRLTDVTDTEQLDVAFGIRRRAVESSRSRTGLFIIALRAVEFTANPIAAYPTSIAGRRTVEDGDIIEGVVATLIPYRDAGGDSEISRRRARTARGLFVDGNSAGLPVDALPLAMVGLERNIVRWLDVSMVRREIGADQSDVLGFGVAPRAVRAAHLRQYDQHLADVLKDRDNANRGHRFSASDEFLALPPAGRMPAAAINAADFSQTYFPPEVDVDLSIIPEDEIPALLEESMLLPPIDLTLTGDALESTAVLVLIPVPAFRVRALSATLTKITRTLRTAAPGLIAQRRPIEVLRGITLPRLPGLVLPTQAPADAAWAAEISNAATSGNGLLWYIRRRNVDYRSDLAGAVVRVTGSDSATEAAVTTTATSLGLATRLTTLRDNSTTLGNAEIVSLVASPKFTDSPLLASAIVADLESARQAPGGVNRGAVDPAPGTTTTTSPLATLDRTAVLQVAEKFSDPSVGEGLSRLTAVSPELATNKEAVAGLAKTGTTLQVDQIARTLPADQLKTFAADIAVAAATGDSKKVAAVLAKTTTVRRLQ
ncbi:MAG TPA: hypothetical protein VK636_06625 [Gemmatimonadaceae bacterium]|nr:hypothetical protein [Gemmatimonadaceae bacterium]